MGRGEVVNNMINNKNILVVGAGGFIGTNLLLHMQKLNCKVRAISRSYLALVPGDNILLITADLNDGAVADEHCAWADIVIYLASEGAPATANENIVASAEQGVVNSLKFFERCVSQNIEKLVYLSSGGTIYGDAEQVPTPETSALKPNNAYSISKMAVEQYLALYKQLGRLNYVVLRASNPYGPYQFATKNQGVIGRFIGLASRGEPVPLWGDGSAIRDYLYVDDLSEAILKAVEYRGSETTFNIGSGVGRSLMEVIECIKATGLDVNVINKPALPAAVAASVLDISLARRELNWEPIVQFEHGVTRFTKWFLLAVQ